MQPPPRKVKPSVALKNIHSDQLSKLQAKHQQECDLLEDMRTFFVRKSALEKEYAQGLQKLTSQLLKREFPAQPDLASEDGLEHKTVCTVWRSILEESDRLAKARLQAAEVYAEKAAEPLKPAKAGKVQCFKKVLPQLTVIHTEVAQCVLDLVKAQKMYATDEGLAHEARQKSSEAEDKLKRKSTGIFQSLASLQKSCNKLRSRTEASEVKETASRNEYVLCLAAANAHQIRYYSTDIPEIMKTLDCDIYEKIQESLTIAGRTAAELAQSESSSYQNIAVEAAKICREFSHQCYLFQNPVFTNLVQYQFEPCHGDTCNKISAEHGANSELEKEARKWSTKIAKETRAVRDYYRQMTILQNVKSSDKTSEAGSQESTTTTDPETKLEELKQNIRKAETSKLKAEARLEALREGGVNVDEWLNQAQMESLAAEESGLARTPSQLSLRTESSGGHSGDDHEQTYTHYDDDDDFIDDTFTSAGNRSGRTYPIYCKALYDFEASNYDEMTIKAEEELELVADGDGEGWVKAKNSLGQEGYIPETYVDLGGLSDQPAPLEVEAMNAINETVSDSAPPAPPLPPVVTAAAVAAKTSGTPDLQSPTSLDFQPDTASSYSSGDLEVQQTTEAMTEDAPPDLPATTAAATTDISWARALYDYEAQTDEELSFLEGALIKVLRKDDNGVDDGFWEGECNGVSGVFPSLVVEEIAYPNIPNDPMSPGNPPPVHVTLPTPDSEPPPPPPTANGEETESDEPLPPPPEMSMLESIEEDSISGGDATTPTADQSPKRVHFASNTQWNDSLARQQLHQQHQQQHQNQQQYQQGLGHNAQHQQLHEHHIQQYLHDQHGQQQQQQIPPHLQQQLLQHYQRLQQQQQQQLQQQRARMSPTMSPMTQRRAIATGKAPVQASSSNPHHKPPTPLSPILRHKSLPNQLNQQTHAVDSQLTSRSSSGETLQCHSPQLSPQQHSPQLSLQQQQQQQMQRHLQQQQQLKQTSGPPPSSHHNHPQALTPQRSNPIHDHNTTPRKDLQTRIAPPPPQNTSPRHSQIIHKAVHPPVQSLSLSLPSLDSNPQPSVVTANLRSPGSAPQHHNNTASNTANRHQRQDSNLSPQQQLLLYVQSQMALQQQKQHQHSQHLQQHPQQQRVAPIHHHQHSDPVSPSLYQTHKPTSSLPTSPVKPSKGGFNPSSTYGPPNSLPRQHQSSKPSDKMPLCVNPDSEDDWEEEGEESLV